MASFTHVLESFRNGRLSKTELFAEVGQIIEHKQSDPSWLLSTLDEQETIPPFTPEIQVELRQQIQNLVSQNDNAQGQSPAINEDFSRTQLATKLFTQPPSEKGHAGQPQESSSPASSSSEPDKMKGTGDVLNGRFVLEERVGSGGMSTVYRALDRRKLEADDRDPYVAVKVLNVEFRAHPDSLVALQREAKKCQRLAHPNIVRVYDFDRDGATVYMTMEYLSGQSLVKTLKAPSFRGMPFEKAMPILEKMVDALTFAHQNGIVHADFKPANVIITEEGEVKIIDFGIARAFQKPGDSEMEATRFDPSSLGALTPTYASPEMLEHLEPDPRDDVYALACIAYEMLTGHHPFGRRQATEARDGGMQLERTVLKKRQWKALQSALAFNRETRTGSARRFLDELREERSFKIPIFAAAGVSAIALAGYFVPQMLKAPVPEPTPLTAVESPPVTTRESTVVENAPAPAPATSTPPEKIPVVVAKPTLQLINPVLDNTSCAALSATINGNSINVNGYLNASKKAAEKLRNKLEALPGVKTVNLKTRPIDEKFCKIIDTYQPFWSAAAQQGGTAIKALHQSAIFVAGEPLIVKITTPAHEAYVYVDYYSLDGQVTHLLPSPRLKANQAPANYTAVLGDLGEWIVSEPYGTELVVIATSPEPVFKKLRKESEKANDYLNDLSRQLKRIANKSGQDRVTTDFLVITTKAKK